MQRDQAHRTNELLERIAIALEKNNKKETQTTKDIVYKSEIPGFEGTLDALENLTNMTEARDYYKEKYENTLTPTSDNPDPAGYDNEKNDELHELVQNLCTNDYLEFCSIHNLNSNDAVSISNYIADLDYEECVGAIKEVENIVETNDRLLNFDYETDLQGLRVDSDHDIRSTASFYEIEYIEKHGATKKECILDYVTNEFGLHGARYTDIIKFAYYLGAHNAPKYDATRDRGYYSLAFSKGQGGYLIQGGKNQLVKGINKEGKERYFALSEVDNFTDYYKRIA